MEIGFKADLHCHTTCSDGTDSPEEVLRKSAQVGLQGLSITDHDTIDAYSPELFLLAKELGIRLLPGIELSSEWEASSIHVLGYGIDLSSNSLRDFMFQMIFRRGERNAAILQKLRGLGFNLQNEDLDRYGDRTIGRPHIAHLMIEKGYVATLKEAFDLYLRDDASCYVPGIRFTPLEVIEQIHQAKGKAVLAHPHFLKKGSFLQTILAMPFDGVEAYYGTQPIAVQQPWVDIARKKNWIVTGGSDYHGTIKPHAVLGSSWVGQATFDALAGSTH